MDSVMATTPDSLDGLLLRAVAGESAALAAVFTHYRERLRRMIHLPGLDRRPTGRVVDASDILQDRLPGSRQADGDGGCCADLQPAVLPLVAACISQKLDRSPPSSSSAPGCATRGGRSRCTAVRCRRRRQPRWRRVQLLGTTTTTQAAVRAEHRIIVQECSTASTQSTVRSWSWRPLLNTSRMT